MQHLAYRKELDGLRAIAVVSVVLFHVGYPDMSGGFTGVDIFFVLSGYLICGQTYLRLEAGNYSVVEFFARRIRRLSTAYFTCFLVTALAVDMLFMLSDFGAAARNLLGSTTFTNNQYLLNTQGYFNNNAHENPFLHTWSLSIEEQFYIVLPILILVTLRSLKAFRILLGVLFVVSLGLTLFSGDLIYDRDERFFSSAFRVWELALGALVFVFVHARGRLAVVPFAPLAGLALVLVPVALLDEGTLYPGWATLLPTMGAAVLIATVDPARSWIGRFLASRVMTYIGRISYGTYLWHWPLIVFLGYGGISFTDVSRAGVFFASLGLGALSYHLIETPVRRINVTRSKRWLFGMFAVQTLILLMVSWYLLHQSRSADAFEGAAVQSIKAESEVYHDGWNACWNKVDEAGFCQFGTPEANGADFFVWGDSMANSAFWAFEGYAEQTGQSGFLAPSPSCAPLVRLARGFSGAPACLEVNKAVLDYLKDAPGMDVFLFARWSYYAEGYSSHKGNEINKVGLVDAAGNSAGDDVFAAFKEAFDQTLEVIGPQHRVIIINQVPAFPYFVPKAMLKQHRFGVEPAPKTVEAFEARSGRVMDLIRDRAQVGGHVLIEPHEDLCKGGTCAYQIDGVPLFSDHVHMSRRGNTYLEAVLLKGMAGR